MSGFGDYKSANHRHNLSEETSGADLICSEQPLLDKLGYCLNILLFRAALSKLCSANIEEPTGGFEGFTEKRCGHISLLFCRADVRNEFPQLTENLSRWNCPEHLRCTT